jgi:hypothetical protein
MEKPVPLFGDRRAAPMAPWIHFKKFLILIQKGSTRQQEMGRRK